MNTPCRSRPDIIPHPDHVTRTSFLHVAPAHGGGVTFAPRRGAEDCDGDRGGVAPSFFLDSSSSADRPRRVPVLADVKRVDRRIDRMSAPMRIASSGQKVTVMTGSDSCAPVRSR